MKEEIPSSEDIQNTLDNLEKEAEKNLEEAKTKLHWAYKNLAGANSALASCKEEANRAKMRLQVIKDMNGKSD